MAIYSVITALVYVDDEQKAIERTTVTLLDECKSVERAKKACLSIFDSIYKVESWENFNHEEKPFVHPGGCYHNIVTYHHYIGYPGYPIINNGVAKKIMKLLGDHSNFWTCEMVDNYNWATDPAALRSDKEHRACDRLARLLLKKLNKYKAGKFTRDEDGRLVCLTKNFWE